MDDEDWGDVGETFQTNTGTTTRVELPEVKLFGKWSCEDVEVSDMSLQVCWNIIPWHFIIIYLVYLRYCGLLLFFFFNFCIGYLIPKDTL